MEYRLEGVADAEPLYRLVTTILDPAQAPAADLAALYHKRWEIESALAVNDLVPARLQPRILFATRDPARSAKVMAALDAVNARYGRGTLRPLATGIARSWSTRHDRLSQRYTTRVEEMLTATAW